LRNPHGLPHLALAKSVGTLLDDVQRGLNGVSSARRAVRPTAERRSRCGGNPIVDPYLRLRRWCLGQVEGGEIRIRALRENRAADGLPQIRIEILDTGVGLGTGPPSEGGGFGVTQVRERLATVYGARGSLTLEATAAGGTLATVVFPT